MRIPLRGLAPAFFLATLVSCAPHAPDRLVLTPVRYDDLAGWREDDHAEALSVFAKSCSTLATRRPEEMMGRGLLAAPASLWQETCARAASVPPAAAPQARQFFEGEFAPLRATNNGRKTGLFTGYYEPEIAGSPVRTGSLLYPIYGLPAPGTPSFSRAEIDQGALQGRASVLAYVADPVALFFLHIQGSGRIRMEDGEILRIGYAGANGQKYVALGRVLADRGELRKEEITTSLIRQWLADHPDRLWETLWENPSYVFFRVTDEDAVGAERVPLTPLRSLAVDARWIPLAMPIFLETTLPVPGGASQSFQRLLIAQDTGGAIRGPVRGDVFFGAGPGAGEIAGDMKSEGIATLLVPRALAARMEKEAK